MPTKNRHLNVSFKVINYWWTIR